MPETQTTDVGTQPEKRKVKETDIKQIFKDAKKAWESKSQDSFRAMIDRYTVLKDCKERVSGVQGGSINEPWKKFVKEDLGMAPSTAERFIDIASYLPFYSTDKKWTKYHSQLPLNWTALYQVTHLVEKGDGDKVTYESYTTALAKGFICPEMTVKEAEAIAQLINRDEFDAEDFSGVVDRLLTERAIRENPPKKDLEKKRKYESFTDAEKDEIFRAYTGVSADADPDPMAAVSEIAFGHNTTSTVVNKIIAEMAELAERSRAATAPAAVAIQPAPETARPETAAVETIDPSQAEIDIETQIDFGDDNDVLFLDAVRDAYTDVQLERARRKIRAVLHEEGMHGITVSLAFAAGA